MSIIFSGTVSVPHTRETTNLGTGNDFEAEVVVFNCNCHTYQEVIALFCQIIPGMAPAKAFELASRRKNNRYVVNKTDPEFSSELQCVIRRRLGGSQWYRHA